MASDPTSPARAEPRGATILDLLAGTAGVACAVRPAFGPRSAHAWRKTDLGRLEWVTSLTLWACYVGAVGLAFLVATRHATYRRAARPAEWGVLALAAQYLFLALARLHATHGTSSILVSRLETGLEADLGPLGRLAAVTGAVCRDRRLRRCAPLARSPVPVPQDAAGDEPDVVLVLGALRRLGAGFRGDLPGGPRQGAGGGPDGLGSVALVASDPGPAGADVLGGLALSVAGAGRCGNASAWLCFPRSPACCIFIRQSRPFDHRRGSWLNWPFLLSWPMDSPRWWAGDWPWSAGGWPKPGTRQAVPIPAATRLPAR